MSAPQLETLAARALEAAKKAGAEAADVVAVRADGISMEIRNGALEQAERAEGTDLGLRVLIGQKQACVSISDMRPDAIRMMAERAVAMAREAPEDPTAGLADPSQLATRWDLAALDLVDPATAPDAAALAEAARAAEAAALAMKGITQVSTAGADYSRTDIHLMATNGFSGGYARTGHNVACVAITGEGLAMERDYAFEGRTHLSDMPTPEEIGRLAAERTLARAGATKPRTGAYPVLFDERIASGLIGHLLSAVNGQAIARGTSWLKHAMGEAVLPAGMSVLEEPHRPRVGGSRPFDAEGLATRDADIVTDGVLRRWVLDLASARKLGLESTANASRGTGAPPLPSVGNIRLTGPQVSRAQLLADMGEGLLVTSLMGSSINPNTGDYSRGASGFWVRGGQIAEPVNECTIAGNLRDMLMTLRMADDARPHLSRVVPSLLVEGLTVAGG
ncbi:TldD/PmbA family protein [Halovulum dunhuangense]|uniref:TldD/PmbA family protein n=1 Tax=Halovulum dunhuangense TaxID=1505036 RepID=A0A849KQA8_9RHOB|nr:metallopeptidase TldD-related protein [Halovulum dunhuangense]NNU79019.1 TldD/PmbA family protein [Halovulum dunhuangense]